MSFAHGQYVGRSMSKIDNYLICEEIGRGGFSSINIGLDVTTKEAVAIKWTTKEEIRRVPNSDKILFNETVLNFLLQHPHVIGVRDIVETNELILKVCPYMAGGDLLKFLQTHQLADDKIRQIARDILSAVEYLHSVGVCHRDIKPENILLSSSLEAFLADFGLASVSRDGILSDHRGSMEYSAPEAIYSSSFDGFKADIWSCGIVLYVMRMRALPPVGKDGRPNISGLSCDYLPFVQRLLALNPNERPSASEAIRDPFFSSCPAGSLSSTSERTDMKPDLMKLSLLSQITLIPLKKIKEALNLHKKPDDWCIEAWMAEQLSIYKPPNQIETANRYTIRMGAADLMKRVSEFVFSQNCTISSPLVSRRITFNGPSGDERISFSCFDTEHEGECEFCALPVQGRRMFDRIVAFIKEIK